MTNELPPLPDSKLRFEISHTKAGERIDYTATQMRAYAEAARKPLLERISKMDGLLRLWLRCPFVDEKSELATMTRAALSEPPK